MVLMSSLEMLTRFEPVGGTPRMLDPVTMISSSSSGGLAPGVGVVGTEAWLDGDGDCCAEATDAPAVTKAIAEAHGINLEITLISPPIASRFIALYCVRATFVAGLS
jgi:hypothetical protein